MSSRGSISDHSSRFTAATAVTVFLVSFTLIALQLFYMRALSVARNYHFSYLVISTALLGFGVSGTFLTFTFEKLARRFDVWSYRFLFFFSMSISLSYSLSRLLPVDIRYIFYSGGQFAILLLYNLLLFLPFFFGAVCIGLTLSYFKRQIPVLYGVNLFGSGIGGVGALAVFHFLPPALLPLSTVVVALAAQLMWLVLVRKSQKQRSTWEPRRGHLPEQILSLLLVLGLGAAALQLPEDMGMGQYKTLAHLRRLERQGDAKQLLTGYSPRMRLDVYEAKSLHQTLFAGPAAGEMPPPQLAVLYDGNPAGTIFQIDESEGARIMDSTPQSLAYRLVRAQRVAGEQ